MLPSDNLEDTPFTGMPHLLWDELKTRRQLKYDKWVLDLLHFPALFWPHTNSSRPVWGPWEAFFVDSGIDSPLFCWLMVETPESKRMAEIDCWNAS